LFASLAESSQYVFKVALGRNYVLQIRSERVFRGNRDVGPPAITDAVVRYAFKYLENVT